MALYTARGLVAVPTDIWTNLDGRLNAPAGNPPQPTLLNGYTPSGARHRTALSIASSLAITNWQPPWQVAGVDYNVGPPSSTSFKDPWPGFPTTTTGSLHADLQAAGFSFNLSWSPGFQITQDTGSTPVCTVDGFDFTTHPLAINAGGGAGTITFTNNKWQFDAANSATSNCVQLGGSDDIVVCRYNFFDGVGNTSPQATTSGILASNSCNVTIEYNYFLNGDDRMITVAPHQPVSGNATLIVRFNLLLNAGWAWPVTGGTDHGDWMQLYAQIPPAGTGYDLVKVEFNCCCNNVPQSSANSQGVQVMAVGGTTGAVFCHNAQMNYNTVIARNGGGTGANGNVNLLLCADNTWIDSTAGSPSSMQNNYFDNSTIEFNTLNFSGIQNGTGPYSGVMTQAININMLDGSNNSGNV